MLVERFVSPLVRDDIFLEFILHFFERLESLRAHILLPVGRLPQLILQSTHFCFRDFRRFLCFGEGGGESVDFLL